MPTVLTMPVPRSQPHSKGSQISLWPRNLIRSAVRFGSQTCKDVEGSQKCYPHSEMHGLFLLQCVAVGMLILANGFFVAAEFALVSIRDTRVEQMLHARMPGARAVRRLQHDLDDFLPAVQLGVTLCSLALGWIGEPLAAQVVLAVFDWFPHPPMHPLFYAHAVAFTAVALGFCLITYFHVVLGELVPKSLALRRAEALAVAVAPPMLFFMAIVRPCVRLLRRSAAVVLRGFDVPITERASAHSPEELKLIATAARRTGRYSRAFRKPLFIVPLNSTTSPSARS